jgi:pimeloyl-ACP methyl ester carboxylesterase
MIRYVLSLSLLCSTGLLAQAQMTDTVRCQTDPTQSYALYVPPKGAAAALPVIYLFDPHGAGILPVKKYKALADAYGFILVGSNNSKNGNDWPTTESIWQHLADDTRGRLKMDMRRIYTVGFSGGAKVASYIAIQHPGVAGVIAGGAGLPDGVAASDFAFSFTAIAGQGDMNLTELTAISEALDKTRTRHRLILFDGKHEWAPVNTMGLAFAGLQFDAMRTGLLPKENFAINTYVAGSKKRLRAYVMTSQLIKAAQECNLSISDLDGLSPQVKFFRQQAAALAANANYQAQRQAQTDLLASEQNTKAGYMQQFQQGDEQYWTNTIRDLESKSAGHSAEQQMYQRLLAYLSLAFYSISNQLMTANDNAQARHFVDLYKLADPTNSEAWYFSAVLDAREGKTGETEADLLKADAAGFRDKARLMQQTEFQRLNPALDVDKILRNMRRL